jgi:hypothetical protein
MQQRYQIWSCSCHTVRILFLPFRRNIFAGTRLGIESFVHNASRRLASRDRTDGDFRIQPETLLSLVWFVNSHSERFRRHYNFVAILHKVILHFCSSFRWKLPVAFNRRPGI